VLRTRRWSGSLPSPVAALLNTKGGTLVIGVEDNGAVYGLTEDYKLCGNKGRDGFENWLMQTLMKDFGEDAASQLAVAFHQLGPADESKPGSADVCIVTVQPSPKPRFAIRHGKRPGDLLRADRQRHQRPEAFGVNRLL
jgi:predicted HTH transcriptional regulator